MNKLDKNYDDYQAIAITDKSLIKDFINTHISVWEEDILKFENFKSILTTDNIVQIDFYSYIGLDEELEYTFILTDDTRKHFHLDKELILKWLTNHNLIK